MRLRQRFIVPVLACCFGAGHVWAQRALPNGDVDVPPTLLVESRLVVEDVLVMDAHGDPVHGLPASAFHVLDNGIPQRIGSVTEGSSMLWQTHAVAALPPGTFSSVSGLSASGSTEVLLVDTDDMGLTDQMFLRQQLRNSVANMPADVPVALFVVRSGRVIPMSTASTDRAALARSIDDVLPVQNHAVDSRFQSALNQLMTVAAYLQQTPGRKNLMWFAGQFPLITEPAPGDVEAGLQPDYSEREHEIHEVREAMVEARVSIFPIDVRGVLPATFAFELAAAVSEGHREMHELAAATGGRAYMLNDLSREIGQAFELGRSAYTLSYSPRPYRIDQSFHRVTVQVDGGYTTSYRTGYLATYVNGPGELSRTRLLQGGKTMVAQAPDTALDFQVRLLPHGDPQRVQVDFSIPMRQLQQEHADGMWSSRLLVSSYVYDASGKVRSGKVQEVDTRLVESQYAAANAGAKRVQTRQDLNVPKGSKYLIVIARDLESQRTGSLVLQTRLLADLPTQTGEGASPPAQPVPRPLP